MKLFLKSLLLALLAFLSYLLIFSSIAFHLEALRPHEKLAPGMKLYERIVSSPRVLDGSAFRQASRAFLAAAPLGQSLLEPGKFWLFPFAPAAAALLTALLFYAVARINILYYRKIKRLMVSFLVIGILAITPLIIFRLGAPSYSQSRLEAYAARHDFGRPLSADTVIESGDSYLHLAIDPGADGDAEMRLEIVQPLVGQKELIRSYPGELFRRFLNFSPSKLVPSPNARFFVYEYELYDSAFSKIAQLPGTSPRWSQDSRFILAQEVDFKESQLYLADLQTGKYVMLTAAAAAGQYFWNGGDEILFVNGWKDIYRVTGFKEFFEGTADNYTFQKMGNLSWCENLAMTGNLIYCSKSAVDLGKKIEPASLFLSPKADVYIIRQDSGQARPVDFQILTVDPLFSPVFLASKNGYLYAKTKNNVDYLIDEQSGQFVYNSAFANGRQADYEKKSALADLVYRLRYPYIPGGLESAAPGFHRSWEKHQITNSQFQVAKSPSFGT